MASVEIKSGSSYVKQAIVKTSSVQVKLRSMLLNLSYFTLLVSGFLMLMYS